MTASTLSISLPLTETPSMASVSSSGFNRSPGSPIFDIPEFPTLRRVKPLPKRRRVVVEEPAPAARPPVTNPSTAVVPHEAIAPIPLDATPEELIAHAERLKTEMAAQGYDHYLPILGGVQDLFRGVAAAAAAASSGGSRTRGRRNSIAASVSDLGNKLSLASEALEKALQHAAAAGVGLGNGGGGSNGGLGMSEEDDEQSDYLDHLQQPGNTKKRKVPANASASSRGRGHDAAGADDDGEQTVGIPTGAPAAGTSPTPASLQRSSRKPRMSPVTLAGIQYKKTLQSRKKQLADVLVSLSLGDSLALDQALSTNYPFAAAAAALSSASSARNSDDLKATLDSVPKVRLSKRESLRLARLARKALKLRHPDKIGLAVADFTFTCSSSTAERLIATKGEVAMLKHRFEAELARQTAKAKLAAANKMIASFPAKSSRHKRGGERAQRQRIAAPASSSNTTTSGGKGGDQNAEFLDHGLVPGKVRTGKKKKRSALANASNPHHLRNYVPSRLPHSGGGGTNPSNQTDANHLGPLPLRFLSAEIPARRRKGSRQNVQPLSNLMNPADEWICAYCEYELFYGDDPDYRRAVRHRKKILRRRRRAQERAAAAASGNSTLKVPEKSKDEDDYDEAEFEPTIDEFAEVPRQTKWKGDPNKDHSGGTGEAASYG